MKFLDEIKNYSAKKAAISLLGLMSLFGTYQMNAQVHPHITTTGAKGIKTTCDLIYVDYNNDGNIDEIKITKDEKNNQIALYLKKGDEYGNLTNFPKPDFRNYPKSTLLINWNSKNYIKAIVQDFDNNGTKDVKFLTRDDKGIRQYLFKGDGNGKFTNNPKERLRLIPVQYKN